MTSSIIDLTKKIAVEHKHNVYEITGFKTVDEVNLEFHVTTNDFFDYFVFIDVPYERLSEINEFIQTKLHEELIENIKRTNEDDIHRFNLYFDKNTTLIITSLIPSDVLTEGLYRIVSSIEEDVYFFKKQVIYYVESELNVVNSILANNENCSIYCNRTISDIVRYEGFLKNNDEEYGFIAKLFQKIPFFSLIVNEMELLDLQAMITSKLSEEESELLTQLLVLDSDEAIDSWITSLESKND